MDPEWATALPTGATALGATADRTTHQEGDRVGVGDLDLPGSLVAYVHGGPSTVGLIHVGVLEAAEYKHPIKWLGMIGTKSFSAQGPMDSLEILSITCCVAVCRGKEIFLATLRRANMFCFVFLRK